MIYLDSIGLLQVSRWLVTYFVHSSLLLGAVWLVHRRLPALSETLWKTALLGGLLTATIQVGFGVESLSGTVHLATTTGAPDTLTATQSPIRGDGMRLGRTAADRPRSKALPSKALPGQEPRTSTLVPIQEPMRPLRLPVRWIESAALVWLIGAILLLAHLGWQTWRFRSRIKNRRDVQDRSVLDRFEHLRAHLGSQRPVRLTTSPHISVPFARGWLRPEICLPERVLTDMDSDKQDAILAHELAHLEHHDPLWLLLTETIARLLFLQPLNRRAARELYEQTELRCDDRAAAITGHPVALARCLTEVAGWNVPANRVPTAAILSTRGSSLSRRVGHLLQRTESAAPRAPWWGLVVSSALLLMVLVLAPGFSAEGEPPAAPAPPRVPAAPELAVAAAAAPALAPFHVQVPSFVIPVLPLIPVAPALAPVAAASPLASAPALAPVQPQKDPDDEADAEDLRIDEEEIEREAKDMEDAREEIAEILEEELEAAMEDFEAKLEAHMEGFEEEIEAAMELIEEDMEALAEELEAEMEALAEEYENETDEDRKRALAAEMQAKGKEFGQLGARIGRAVGGAELGPFLSSIVEPITRQAQAMASQHQELAGLLRESLRAAELEGRRPSEAEIEQLRARARQLAAELKPRREEIERMREELEKNLGPMRERMSTLGETIRKEMEQWRKDHEDAIRDRQRAVRERVRAARERERTRDGEPSP